MKPQVRATWHGLMVLLVLIEGTNLIPAQTGSSDMIGTIQASMSAMPISDAVVTITNEGTHQSRTTITDEAGLYVVSFLAPGQYTVHAEHPGFVPATSRGIYLDIRQVTRVDLRLKPMSNTLEVDLDTPNFSLTTDSSDSGTSINRDQITVLPLASRDFAGLQILSPGAQPASSVGGFAGRELSEGFRITGGNLYSGAFSIEQADNNRSYYYGNASSPSLEMIRGVKIQTAGASSEYRGGSYQVDVSLESGGSRIHGSLFEYLQHDQMTAANAMSGANTPHLRRSQYGGSISGPLRRDSLFFFGVYEGIRQRGGEPVTTQVATADQRVGSFPLTGSDAVIVRDPLTGKPFTGNQIPVFRFSPLASHFLDHVWPLPNAGTQIYRENSIAVVNSDQFHLKLDYLYDKSNLLSFYFSRQKLAFDQEISPTLLSPRIDRFDNLFADVRYTRTINPRMANSLILAAHRDYNVARSKSDLGPGASFAERIGLTLGGPTGAGYPLIEISGRGFSGRTGQQATPTEHTGNTYQLQDTLRWMRGSHDLSFGLEIKRFQNNEADDVTGVGQFSFNGRYSGSGLADFLLGLPNQIHYTPAIGLLYLGNTLGSAYAQDSWRIRRNLNLSLGVRYEYLSWPTERYDRMATSYPHLGMQVIVSSATDQLPGRIDPVALASFPAGTFITSNRAGLPRSLRYPDGNNFSPQIGLAWWVAPRLVIRSSYRIDYLKNSQAVFNDREAGLGFPFRIQRAVTNPSPLTFNILQPFANLVPKIQNEIESTWYVDPHFKMAYMQTWAFHLESVMPFHSLLQVGYVGNRMVHGKQTWNWNQSLTWPNRNDRFPGYTNILALTSGADSRYHSLQINVRRQVGQGLLGQAAYTFSKTLTNVVPDGEPLSIWLHDPAMQWGRRRWDRSHLVTGSLIYTIPFGRDRRWFQSMPQILDGMIGGWRLSGIVRVMSGKPLTITSSLAKANLSVQGNVPADRLSEGRLEHPNDGRWFDQTAFATPPAYRPGNSGYGILNGPGFLTEDLALYKHFRVREGVQMQLRVEAYNAFNHVNLGDPISDVDNWSFLGKILTSGSAFRAQVALRIDF